MNDKPSKKRKVYRGLDIYGVSHDEYKIMLKNQDGVCAICGGEGKNKRLAMDHNHKTGEFRGLLCHRCNLGLGLFRDDTDIMSAAISYILRTDHGY